MGRIELIEATIDNVGVVSSIEEANGAVAIIDGEEAIPLVFCAGAPEVGTRDASTLKSMMQGFGLLIVLWEKSSYEDEVDAKAAVMSWWANVK